MAILNLWKNFTKRKNSTKQPSGSADTSLTSVYLKEGTSLQAPVFVIKSNDFTYNYAQFNGTYYFIDDIVSLKNDLIELHCSRDLLATYKSAIQASSAFVLYYSHNNTEITDRRLSTKTTKTVVKKTGVFDTLGNGTGTNYAVALNCIGENACDTYILNQADARTILSNLDNWFDNSGDYDPGTGTKEGSWIPDLAQLLFGTPAEAIESCMISTKAFWRQVFATGKASDNLRSAVMLPLPVSAIGGDTADIWLGKYNTGISATRIRDRIFSDGCSVDIPWPTNINDWRRNSPFTELYLYIPYIGIINLSPSDLIGDSSLNVSVSIDLTSGDAVFTVYTDTNRFIGQYNTNMAASFAIGTANVPVAQMFNSVLGAITTGAAAAATGGASQIIGATGNGLSLANIIAGTPTCIGSNSGGAVLGLTDNVVCYSIFHDTTVDPHGATLRAVKGEPFNGAMSLSGVSGYVQTAGASVSMAAFGNDKDIVNNYLDGGIYIE